MEGGTRGGGKIAEAAALEAANKEDDMDVEETESEGEAKEGKDKEQEGYDSEDPDGEIVRNLEKEMDTPAGKKRRSRELMATPKAKPMGASRTQALTMSALRSSSYTPHKHIF